MDLIGLAQRFEVLPFWNGPVEADFLNGLDHQPKVIHATQGPYGLDVGETAVAASGISTGVMSRAPQNTPLMYPYTFMSRDGKALMTGTPSLSPPAHGNSCLWMRGGGTDATWWSQGTILTEKSAPWDRIFNNPMVDLPGGQWLCMPEISGGIGVAISTSWAGLNAGKSSCLVIPGAGNGALRTYRDTHLVLWLGLIDPSRYGGCWFTTIATARISDVVAAPGNPANWTVHKDRFAVGMKNIHVCDPSPWDSPDGGRVLISYDQNAGLKMLRSSHSLTDLYAELVG